jgi:hypothetical protein
MLDENIIHGKIWATRLFICFAARSRGAGTAVLVQRLRRTALCWDFLRIFISKLSCCSFSVVNVVLSMTNPLAGNMITEM